MVRCLIDRRRVCRPAALRPARALAALTLALLLASQLPAQLPTTQLTAVFPPGGKPGTSLDVTVSGGDVDDLTQLLFSHPGITAAAKMNEGSEFQPPEPLAGQFTVSIGGDVPPGIYEARVAGQFGLSNPRAFAVGNYDNLIDGGGNNSTGQALAVEVDKTVNGSVDGNNRDYFKLTLKQGQRVLIDCLAERIDSRLNGTLVLYDAQGKELARNLDAIGLDPFLDFTAPVEGDYFVSLYDFVYRGGGEFFYRLTVHLGPHVDFVFPPSGPPGSQQSYTVYGRNLPGGQPSDVSLDGVQLEKLTATISLPADDAARQLEFAALVPPSGALLDAFLYRLDSAAPLPIYFAQAPVVAESADNDQPGQAQTVTAPCELVGQFYPARDVDWVQFEAKKGDVFYVDLYSHRLNLDVDPRFVVQRVTKNDQGEENVAEIANVDDVGNRNNRIGGDFDTSTDDPSYRLAADQDAIYRIMLKDQFGGSRQDPRTLYRLAIRQAQPDFRLAAVTQPLTTPANANVVRMGSASLRKGGTVLLHVEADRQDGFDGEIELAVEGLPEGVISRGAFIAPGQNAASLILEAAENAADWAGTIRVLGKAKIGDADVVRYARGGAVVWGTGNRQQDPPVFRATRDLALAVMGHEEAPAWVEVGENKVWETSRGGKLEIPIKVARRRGFNADLALAPNGLPNEIKPKNITVKGDAGEAKLELAITNANAKPGIYTFYLRADTKGKLVRHPVAVARAEESAKQLEAKVQEVDEAGKKAVTDKDAAVKAAQEAEAAAKQADEAKTKAAAEAETAAAAAKQAAEKLAAAKEAAAKDTGNQGLADAAAAAEKAKTDADAAHTAAAEKLVAAEKTAAEAQQKNKTAQEAQAAAEKTAADMAEKLKKVQALKAAADKKVADVKKANQPKDFNFVAVSTPVRLRIVPSPLKVTAGDTSSLAQGGNVEVPVTLERLYGFADKVDLVFELPKGVAGLAVKPLSLEKDQAEGKFEVTAEEQAPPGNHTVTIRARAKFNNIDVESTRQIVLKVEPKEPAAP